MVGFGCSSHSARELPGSVSCYSTGALAAADRLLLSERAPIESIVDQLKNVFQIEHSRHRSPPTLLVHPMAGLIYWKQPTKPSLDLGLPTLLAA